ncbi:MAG: CAP domain-containing protein [Phormidesmis sp. RL_2_1]|nr:CAP domain-containing protein [Phormidesmis sp. RL_2_1]
MMKVNRFNPKILVRNMRYGPMRYGPTSLAIGASVLAVFCGHSPQQDGQFTFPLAVGAVAHAQTIAQVSEQPDWAVVEREIIAEHNRVRQNPQSYIPILEAYLARMDTRGNIPNGCGPNCTLLTQEGRAAVQEAINFLRNQTAVGPLTLSEGAAQAAKAHAQDQRNGAIGHIGSDGRNSSQRLSRFGVQNSSSGENIDYGSSTAQEVLVSLIVDDGVANRGHRANIFSPDWTMAGAGCGAHATYRTVCVIDYIKVPQATAGTGATNASPSGSQQSGTQQSGSQQSGSQNSSQTIASNQLRVINNGTVALLSLKIADVDILGGPLAVGQSRDITLAANQSCRVNLAIQLGGNYRNLDWNNLDVCGATMNISDRNGFRVSY